MPRWGSSLYLLLLLLVAVASEPPALFDMVTILRTPTCINHRTVMNAARYLPQKGLRYIFVVTPSRWVEDVGRWHERVRGVDESFAAPGVSRKAIEAVLTKYGYGEVTTGDHYQGRATPGWYLVQLVNLGFVLRPDVLDTLLVHDADQMILPNFEVFGNGTFMHDGAERKRFAVKVGGHFEHRCVRGPRIPRISST